MTDLTPSQWREIEEASIAGTAGRVIVLGTLRTIIRKSRRSTDQNALLWALYDDILRNGGESLGGWTSTDLHEYLLGEHFGWTEHKAFGKTRLKPNRRSSRLTKSEFSDLLSFIVHRMAEHGIILSLPDDPIKKTEPPDKP
jgi:hypothetical protein